MAKGEKIIGIDLGTTNSVVAVMEGREAKVIPNAEGNRLTPSVVAFNDKGETLVGEPARRQQTNPKTNGLLISASWAAGIMKSVPRKNRPLRGRRGPEDYVKVRVDNHEYTPPEISAKPCGSSRVRRGLSRAQGQKAVITVPAYFNDAQRQATGRRPDCRSGVVADHQRTDGRLAGLRAGQENLGENRRFRSRRGRSTFRFSRPTALPRNQHQRRHPPRRRRFDQTLINYAADELRRSRARPRKDMMALQRLQEACEKAKGTQFRPVH